MFLIEYLADFRYLGLFILLFLCGMGLPIPEDLAVAAGGYLASIGEIRFFPALVVMISAATAGDFMLYVLGRRYGPDILAHRRLERFFTPERIHRINHYFHDYGSYTFFFARFLIGLRSTIFLAAGAFQVSWKRILVFDLLSAILSMGLIASLAYMFGEKIREIHRWEYSIPALIFLFILIFVIYLRRRSRRLALKNRVQTTEKIEPPSDIDSHIKKQD